MSRALRVRKDVERKSRQNIFVSCYRDDSTTNQACTHVTLIFLHNWSISELKKASSTVQGRGRAKNKVTETGPTWNVQYRIANCRAASGSGSEKRQSSSYIECISTKIKHRKLHFEKPHTPCQHVSVQSCSLLQLWDITSCLPELIENRFLKSNRNILCCVSRFFADSQNTGSKTKPCFK